MQGARASAIMILTMLNWINWVPVCKGLKDIKYQMKKHSHNQCPPCWEVRQPAGMPGWQEVPLDRWVVINGRSTCLLSALRSWWDSGWEVGCPLPHGSHCPGNCTTNSITASAFINTPEKVTTPWHEGEKVSEKMMRYWFWSARVFPIMAK